MLKLNNNKNYIFTATEKYKLLVKRLKRIILKALKYIIVTERKNALTIDETYLIETIVYKKSPLTLCNS